MKRALNLFFVAVVTAFAVWLFMNEKAAEPGALTNQHAGAAYCQDCHAPWVGVSDDKCLGCHEFSDVEYLRPALRFHQAEKYCLRCHTEHRGEIGGISFMDHTLLSPELNCQDCHLDPHEQLFGGNCRECHGIRTWRIPGFRHPSARDENCNRCHVAPLSHQGEHFKDLILRSHLAGTQDTSTVKPDECWQCHVVHDWRHRLM